MISRKEHKEDCYIVFAVMIQYLLALLQECLIAIFRIPAEQTTIYRVLLTAIPLTVAIIIAFKRRPILFVVTYTIVLLVLFLNVVLYPHNSDVLIYDSLRFVLPVVIPSALCLMSISSIELVEKVVYKLSWFSVLFVVIYMVEYLRGRFVIDTYNMTFSYSILLPMISLYSYNSKLSKTISIVLFFIVLSIGSRGAAGIFLIYVMYDIVQRNKKLILPISILAVLFILSLTDIVEWLASIGLKSRTITLLLEGNIDNLSERDYIYNEVIEKLKVSPICGYGLWADRVILKNTDTYCHNIVLEILLNWGMILGAIILLGITFSIMYLYVRSDKYERNIIVKYFCALIMPFMASQSYLVDYKFSVFIAILFLLNKKLKLSL